MLKSLYNFLKNLEQYEPESFWLCSLVLYFSFSTGFDGLCQKPLIQTPVVIEQLRGGGQKKFNLAFHRQLEQHFPDWPGRMDYQKKQADFYKSAMRKKRELKRYGILDYNSRYNYKAPQPRTLYTAEELDSMDYFQGTGPYAKYQNRKVKPNMFDTRQSFLLKMHDDKLRNDFLSKFK